MDENLASWGNRHDKAPVADKSAAKITAAVKQEFTYGFYAGEKRLGDGTKDR